MSRLDLEALEPREVPALLAVGADAGGGPHVKVFDASSGQLLFNFMAYDPSFRGGVRVATGDVTGDGQDDIVTAAGAGGGPHVKIYDGATGKLVREFMAYDPSFRGGAYMAVADVDNDGDDDVITGPGAGGGPHLKVFSGADNSLLKSFLALPREDGMTDAEYYTGITVAGGDMNGDGYADVVAGTGPNRFSKALAYDGKTDVLLVYLQPIYGGFYGGVFISCGDVDGDHRADLAISLGAGIRAGEFPSTVFVNAYGGFPTQAVAGVEAAYDRAFHGGVRHTLVDVNGDGVDEFVTAPGPGSVPVVNVFSNRGELLRSFTAYDAAFSGGVFVG